MRQSANVLSFITLSFLLFFSFLPTAHGSPLTLPFGGKVLSTAIPGIECPSSVNSTAPVVTSRNLISLVGGGVVAASHASAAVKAAAVVGGIYGAIPFQFNWIQSNNGSVSSPPRVGQWFLGRYNVIPSFDSCEIITPAGTIPFPVKTTTFYKTSK